VAQPAAQPPEGKTPVRDARPAYCIEGVGRLLSCSDERGCCFVLGGNGVDDGLDESTSIAAALPRQFGGGVSAPATFVS
jgi:hypothetical protein